MNNLIFSLINKQLQDELDNLANIFMVDKTEAKNLINHNINWDILKRCKKNHHYENNEEGSIVKDRCVARIWNNGLGAQCSRLSTNGSEFCKTHASLKYPKWCEGCYRDFGENRKHDYRWEHFGKITDPLPKCFTN